jgi:acetylornithine deacetylase
MVVKRIINRVQGKREEIIKLLSDLIQIPSTTGEEGDAQEFVAKQYREMGLDVDVWEPDVKELFDKFPYIAQYPSHWEHDFILPYQDLPTYEALVKSNKSGILNYTHRPNVVGKWKGSGGGRSLILNAHIDTVTVAPRQKWTHDPFGGEVIGGNIYGRGASDDKGGVVAGITAIRCLQALGIKLRGDVILESVVNEEHSGNGTLACIARGYIADAALALEPSENKVRLCGYGCVYWGINISGRALPSKCRWEGTELRGVSANEKLPGIINQLLQLESDLNKTPVNDFYQGEMPFIMNIGKVRGGKYDTASAGSCSIRGKIHFGPDIGSVNKVMGLFKEYVMRAAVNDPWLKEHPPVVKFFHHDDANWIDAGEEIVKTVIEAGEKALGQKPEIIAGRGTNDCRHLINQGGIPSFVFGPGTAGQEHTIDESIRIEDLIANVKSLAVTIYDWCK